MMTTKINTKRIKANIDTGMYFAGAFAHEVEPSENYPSYSYIITWHNGRMPAYATERFDTLEDLARRMKEYSGDLRIWKLCDYED